MAHPEEWPSTMLCFHIQSCSTSTQTISLIIITSLGSYTPMICVSLPSPITFKLLKKDCQKLYLAKTKIKKGTLFKRYITKAIEQTSKFTWAITKSRQKITSCLPKTAVSPNFMAHQLAYSTPLSLDGFSNATTLMSLSLSSLWEFYKKW